MLERLSPGKRNWALAGLSAALLWFAWSVRAVLNPLILGYLLAYILNPMVGNLERRGWGRRAAANLIFVSFFVVLTAVGATVLQQGSALVRDLTTSDLATEVRRSLPEWVRGMLGGEADAAEEEADAGGAVEVGGSGDVEPQTAGPVAETDPAVDPTMGEALAEALGQLWTEIRAEQASDVRELALRQAGTVWPWLRSFFGSLLALGTLLFLLPIYAYFLLFELDRIHEFVLRYVPAREKERLSRIAGQMGEVLASFFRGRLLICVLKGAVVTAGLWIAGVPYFVLLGMGSGFLALAPFVGPLLGFAGAFLLVLAEEGWLVAGLKTGVVFGLAEVIEGYVLLPRILGNSLGLHPVVVLASVFVGGAALGMFGFLIAVPLAAAAVIVARELVLPALADWADEGGAGDEDGDGGGDGS